LGTTIEWSVDTLESEDREESHKARRLTSVCNLISKMRKKH